MFKEFEIESLGDLEKFIAWCFEVYRERLYPHPDDSLWIAVDPIKQRWEIYSKEPNLLKGVEEKIWGYPGFISHIELFRADYVPKYKGTQYLKFNLEKKPNV